MIHFPSHDEERKERPGGQAARKRRRLAANAWYLQRTRGLLSSVPRVRRRRFLAGAVDAPALRVVVKAEECPLFALLFVCKCKCSTCTCSKMGPPSNQRGT